MTTTQERRDFAVLTRDSARRHFALAASLAVTSPVTLSWYYGASVVLWGAMMLLTLVPLNVMPSGLDRTRLAYAASCVLPYPVRWLHLVTRDLQLEARRLSGLRAARP